MWNRDREWAFGIVREEERKWAALPEIETQTRAKLHAQMSELQEQLAFNIGLTRRDLLQKLNTDSDFSDKYKIALENGISWQDAETICQEQIARQATFLDQVGHSLDSRFPKKIKPKKVFQQFHKRRPLPTKAKLAERATKYAEWKKAYDAINTE